MPSDIYIGLISSGQTQKINEPVNINTTEDMFHCPVKKKSFWFGTGLLSKQTNSPTANNEMWIADSLRTHIKGKKEILTKIQ